MFSSYIRELTWSPGHSFVLRYILLESLPVRDHLRAGIICEPESFAGLYSTTSVKISELSIIYR